MGSKRCGSARCDRGRRHSHAANLNRGRSRKVAAGKGIASYLIARGQDDYQVVFTLAEVDEQFANEHILIADQRGGKPLSSYPGQGSFRLIVPNDHAGARSVRMLESIVLVRLQK